MADRRPHILFVGLRWPPETFLARLVRGLLMQGHQVTVATPNQPEQEWLEQPGFHWLYSPNWDGPLSRRLLNLGRFGLRSFIKGPAARRTLSPRDSLRTWYECLPVATGDWDIIYFPWNSAAMRRLPLYDLGLPVVVSCRGSQVNVAPYDLGNANYVRRLQMSLKRATAIHCVSADIQEEAMKYDAESHKCHIITPAVDPAYFQPARHPSAPGAGLKLITTGSLIWRKGFEYLLTSLRLLLDQNIPAQLEIIGDGPERLRLLYTIQDLGLEEAVQLHGLLKPEQVLSRLQQADVFLLTSLSEGISNAVLEAMACGLAVVSTDCGGMREAITDGQDGLLVPVRDPAAMAKAVTMLWENPEQRRRLGEQARQRICDQFTLAQQAEAFSALFCQVTNGQHQPKTSISHE
ncbi:MAG: glycosyltransferase family 4 protein [Anaerolineales bacterium]|nr:glycosyltransferase family 4 protein [Anaerolineales bacterium]